MERMRLFGEPGWGSTIVEVQLDWYGLEYDFERVGDLFKSAQGESTEGNSTHGKSTESTAEGRRRLAAVNPLAQIPTLVLADGTVMTESAAITLYLADLTGQDSLVPSGDAPQRAAFLRWLVFLVANVYPTYTYADDPSRFVEADEPQRAFKARVFAYAERLYSLLEETAGSPWFLGERFSALDI